MPSIAWDDLRYVIMVARFGTIAEAARRLTVDEATVGRRIARIERQLEARLFDRANGRLVPTEAGKAAAARTERVEQEIEALVAMAAGADRIVAGRVRLTAVPTIVNRILIPALPSLLASNPSLWVDLVAESKDLSPAKREVDLAVRLARPTREMRTLARRIGQLNYAVYGPRGTDAQNLAWINYEDMMADLPQARWIGERIETTGEREAAVRVNYAEGLVCALEKGIGKSLLPTVIGDTTPGLIRLGETSPPLTREIWLLTHPELRGLRRIQVVSDWLEAAVNLRTPHSIDV
jgi:DNA-binding transcriptional LysR family regulator